eukprot:TRINITY_DN7166_c0_g1_i1.p1 TRINITY_DN7166_c0_g1~~TRINITY_DN7166_c0_g1_i1.p1  ORF type:complete len:945 (+),score=251.73 TRINITY_DN7166_c0_g1_i1:368-3202(+)
MQQLAFLYEDESATVVKRVIMCVTNIFRRSIILLCKEKSSPSPPSHVQMWQDLSALKKKILNNVTQENNDAIKTQSLKFLETVVLTYLPVDEGRMHKFPDNFTIQMISSTHPLLSRDSLINEGRSIYNNLLSYLQQTNFSSTSVLLIITILTNVGQQCPSLLPQIVENFLSLYRSPSHFSPPQLQSVHHTLKNSLLLFLRSRTLYIKNRQLCELIFSNLEGFGVSREQIDSIRRSLEPQAKRNVSNVETSEGNSEEKRSKTVSNEEEDNGDENEPYQRRRKTSNSRPPPSQPQSQSQTQPLSQPLPQPSKSQQVPDEYGQFKSGLAPDPRLPEINQLQPEMMADLIIEFFTNFHPSMLANNQLAIPGLEHIFQKFIELYYNPSVVTPQTKIDPRADPRTRARDPRLRSSEATAADQPMAEQQPTITSTTSITSQPMAPTPPTLTPPTPSIPNIPNIPNIPPTPMPTAAPPPTPSYQPVHTPPSQPSVNTQPKPTSQPPPKAIPLDIKPLSSEQLNSLNEQAFIRIMESEDGAKLGGKVSLRISLLVQLVCQQPNNEKLRDRLKQYIVSSLNERVEVLLVWLYHEYYLVTDFGENKPTKGEEKRYSELLLSLLEAVKSKTDPKDKLFTKILMEVPYVPSEVLPLVQSFCEDEARVTVGLCALRDLVLGVVPLRDKSLEILLNYTTHKEAFLRNASTALTTNILFAESRLAPRIEAFAHSSVQKASGKETEEDIKRNLFLFFALCTKKHDLLFGLAEAYVNSVPAVQKVILKQIVQCIKKIGPSSPQLLNLIGSFPRGAETLILQIIHILTEGGGPTPELVLAVKNLFARLPDARFLIPIISGMTKEEAVSFLPKFVTLPSNSLKTVLQKMLNNKPSPLSSSELLVQLHLLEPNQNLPLKKIIEATQMCFEQKEHYKQDTLTVVINKLVDSPQIPYSALILSLIHI